MDINNLKAFVAVAENRSFSRSAKALGLSQPAISKRITALETALSARLFDRSGRTVHLTEKGEMLLPTALQISEELDRVVEIIDGLHGEAVTGQLKIAAAPGISTYHLPDLLMQFQKHHPNIDIDIRFCGSAQALESVESRGCELAVCRFDDKSKQRFNFIDLWTIEWCVAVAHDHPLCIIEGPIDAGCLGKYQCIPSATKKHLLAEQHAMSEETENLEATKTMISNGIGWGYVPLFMMDDSMVVLDIPQLSKKERMGIAYAHNRTLSGVAKALVEFTTENVEI